MAIRQRTMATVLRRVKRGEIRALREELSAESRDLETFGVADAMTTGEIPWDQPTSGHEGQLSNLDEKAPPPSSMDDGNEC